MDGENRIDLIYKISVRAKEMYPEIDRVTIMMDVMNADEHYHMRLEEMLNANNLDFSHDIAGIYRHMDRDVMSPTYGKCKDLFVPRFAGKYGKNGE